MHHLARNSCLLQVILFEATTYSAIVRWNKFLFLAIFLFHNAMKKVIVNLEEERIYFELIIKWSRHSIHRFLSSFLRVDMFTCYSGVRSPEFIAHMHDYW